MHIFVNTVSGDHQVKTPPTVHWDVEEVETASPNVQLTDQEGDWLVEPDWTNIPPGIGMRALGESGFAWEEIVYGGKIVAIFDEGLRMPNTADH